jgi:arylsulfatase A-like enzyme
MKRRALALIILIVCVTAASVSKTTEADFGGTQTSDLPRNVILITISSLRADHLSCLGYTRDTTPGFDAFAGENILFRNAFATSGWMMPAHGSIFTSLYPTVHGATHIDKSLGQERRTLAEILADNGYYCAGFCCNPRLDREHGFAQGFHLYDDYSVSIMLESLAFEDTASVDINRQRTNALINDAAIRWLQNNTHRPFFMFIHYYDNHWDYLPPEPYSELYDPDYDGPIDGTLIAREPLFSNPPGERDIQHIIALYDGEVRQTDNDLGEFLNVLKDTGLSDNSIIIIMGDHGEQFYEHGHTSHHGIYDELIHVPLAASIPGAPAKCNTIDSLVSQVDILPTILNYLQIPVPPQLQGKSLKPLIEGRTKAVNEFVFAEYTGGAAPDCYAVRSTRYKYCRQVEGEPFVYDLAKDRTEQKRTVLDRDSEEIRTLEENLLRSIKATMSEPAD